MTTTDEPTLQKDSPKIMMVMSDHLEQPIVWCLAYAQQAYDQTLWCLETIQRAVESAIARLKDRGLEGLRRDPLSPEETRTWQAIYVWQARGQFALRAADEARHLRERASPALPGLDRIEMTGLLYQARDALREAAGRASHQDDAAFWNEGGTGYSALEALGTLLDNLEAQSK